MMTRRKKTPSHGKTMKSLRSLVFNKDSLPKLAGQLFAGLVESGSLGTFFLKGLFHIVASP